MVKIFVYFLIYDFASDPIKISLHMRKILFSFYQSRASLIRISLSTFKMNRISCVIKDRLVEIQGTGLSLTLCPWTDHILGPYMRYTHLYIFIIFRYVTHKISLVWLALSIVSWSPHLHEYCCKEILRSHC
jgi:hypothetical protein